MPTEFKTIESKMLPPIISGLTLAKRQTIPQKRSTIPQIRQIVPSNFISQSPLLLGVVLHSLNIAEGFLSKSQAFGGNF